VGTRAPGPSLEPQWLTLGEAARLLGVDVTTLRAWADAGKVRMFRTPGGHRRFIRADLDTLLRGSTSALLPRAQAFPSGGAAASRQWLASRSWYAAVPEESRARVRACCAELMHIVEAAGAGGGAEPGRAAAARRLGAALGREVAAWGLTPAQSTEVFLHFKRQVTDAVVDSAAAASERLRSVRDLDGLLAGVLQAMMEAYESGTGRSPSAAGRGR
jgi:excisionase family DNA binding protein